MVSHALPLIGLLTSARVAAQEISTTSIASVFLPNAEQFAYGVMGSIVTADARKTALLLECPPDSNTDFCQYMFGDIVTYGPTTFSYDVPLATTEWPSSGSTQVASYNRACSFDTNADIAYCTEERISGSPGDAHPTRYTVATSKFAELRTDVTITAGFHNVNVSPGSSPQSSAPFPTAIPGNSV